MKLGEVVIVVVLIVAATVAAAVLGDVPPTLAGIFGVCLGWLGKGIHAASKEPAGGEMF